MFLLQQAFILGVVNKYVDRDMNILFMLFIQGIYVMALEKGQALDKHFWVCP